MTVLPRAVFRTQSKVYDGAFSKKKLTVFAEMSHHKC